MHDSKQVLTPGDERVLQYIPLEEKAKAAADLVAATSQVQQIILYGSLAKDSHGESSDIDLVVIVHDDTLVDEKGEIETRLQGMGFSFGSGKGQIHLNVLTMDGYGQMLKSGHGRKLLEEYEQGESLYTKDKSDPGKTPHKGIRL